MFSEHSGGVLKSSKLKFCRTMQAELLTLGKLQPSFCLESHVSFNSRPNVRGTLVAVEKAASHSVSLSTIITWGARSRFKRVW